MKAAILILLLLKGCSPPKPIVKHHYVGSYIVIETLNILPIDCPQGRKCI